MTEREAFEAWASDNNEWPQCIERSGDSYKLMQTKLKWEAWQARAQPAQAVPGSTDEYEQWAKDGRPMPVQAVPVLTYEEIEAVLQQPIGDRKGNRYYIFAEAIEQAVRAKMGVAVPMTREQMKSLLTDNGYTNAPPQERAHFINGVRAVERHHGIVGKEGA